MRNTPEAVASGALQIKLVAGAGTNFNIRTPHALDFTAKYFSSCVLHPHLYPSKWKLRRTGRELGLNECDGAIAEQEAAERRHAR
jgi:hypothetical protein